MGQLAPSVPQRSDQDPRRRLLSHLGRGSSTSYVISFCGTTSLQSLEIARGTMLSGKVKVMIAGDSDDIHEAPTSLLRIEDGAFADLPGQTDFHVGINETGSCCRLQR